MTFRSSSVASSMNNSILNTPIEAQHTGVPFDFRYPNHPQFPGDLEAQLPHRQFMSKKARSIAVGVIVVILAVVTTVVVGVRVGMGMAKKAIVGPVTSMASTEISTVC